MRSLLPALLLALALPAEAGPNRFGASFGDDSGGDGSIGNVTECLSVGKNTGVDSTADSVPGPALFTKATAQFSATAGLSATPQLTHWWAYDSAGDNGITPKATTTLAFGATTATDAWVVELFTDLPPYVPDSRSTLGVVYFCMALDQGTAHVDLVKLEWWKL